MNYLRQLQAERPVLFWIGALVAFYVVFQLVLYVVGLIIGPLGLPSWAPLALVLVGLVVVARRQQR